MFLDLLFLWIAYDQILSNFCFSFLLYPELKIRIDLDLSRSWELPFNILVSLSQWCMALNKHITVANLLDRAVTDYSWKYLTAPKLTIFEVTFIKNFLPCLNKYCVFPKFNLKFLKHPVYRYISCASQCNGIRLITFSIDHFISK